MSFKRNESHQSMDPSNDRFKQLAPRAQKVVLTSWAKPFADHIFPSINEQRFLPLYSSNPASRPNTPVNIIISLMILKEMFQLTDEELLETVECDIRFQYAIHTTSCPEQPISDRTLSRFRERNARYYQETGIDLIHEELESLADNICSILGVDTRFFRMDSVMVEASCKRMSRMELIHASIQDLCQAVLREGSELLPDKFRHYCHPSDRNHLLYHEKERATSEKMEQLLQDGYELLHQAGSPSPHTEQAFSILKRVFAEQTEWTDGTLCLRDGKTISPRSIQNPSDPDATYRFKQGDHVGYVAHVVETVHPEGNIIRHMDYQPNVYSDSQFCQDTIQKMGVQEETVTLLADGAYSGQNNVKLGKEHHIALITTNFVGKKNHPCKAQFMLSEDKSCVTSCPSGQKPNSCKHWEQAEGTYRLVFEKETCVSCPLKDHCGVKIQKRTAVVQILKSTIEQTRYMLLLETSEYKQFARIRNGIEAIPSLLRRKYRVDGIPVHGFVRSKIYFLFKIGAINVKRMIKSLQRKEHDQRKVLLDIFFYFFNKYGVQNSFIFE